MLHNVEGTLSDKTETQGSCKSKPTDDIRYLDHIMDTSVASNINSSDVSPKDNSSPKKSEHKISPKKSPLKQSSSSHEDDDEMEEIEEIIEEEIEVEVTDDEAIENQEREMREEAERKSKQHVASDKSSSKKERDSSSDKTHSRKDYSASSDKSSDKYGEKSSDKYGDKSSDKSSDKYGDKSSDKSRSRKDKKRSKKSRSIDNFEIDHDFVLVKDTVPIDENMILKDSYYSESEKNREHKSDSYYKDSDKDKRREKSHSYYNDSDKKRDKSDNYRKDEKRRDKSDSYYKDSDKKREKLDNYNNDSERKRDKSDNYSNDSERKRDKSDNYNDDYEKKKDRSDNSDKPKVEFIKRTKKSKSFRNDTSKYRSDSKWEEKETHLVNENFWEDETIMPAKDSPVFSKKKKRNKSKEQTVQLSWNDEERYQDNVKEEEMETKDSKVSKDVFHESKSKHHHEDDKKDREKKRKDSSENDKQEKDQDELEKRTIESIDDDVIIIKIEKGNKKLPPQINKTNSDKSDSYRKDKDRSRDDKRDRDSHRSRESDRYETDSSSKSKHKKDRKKDRSRSRSRSRRDRNRDGDRSRSRENSKRSDSRDRSRRSRSNERSKRSRSRERKRGDKSRSQSHERSHKKKKRDRSKERKSGRNDNEREYSYEKENRYYEEEFKERKRKGKRDRDSELSGGSKQSSKVDEEDNYVETKRSKHSEDYDNSHDSSSNFFESCKKTTGSEFDHSGNSEPNMVAKSIPVISLGNKKNNIRTYSDSDSDSENTGTVFNEQGDSGLTEDKEPIFQRLSDTQTKNIPVPITGNNNKPRDNKRHIRPFNIDYRQSNKELVRNPDFQDDDSVSPPENFQRRGGINEDGDYDPAYPTEEPEEPPALPPEPAPLPLGDPPLPPHPPPPFSHLMEENFLEQRMSPLPPPPHGGPPPPGQGLLGDGGAFIQLQPGEQPPPGMPVHLQMMPPNFQPGLPPQRQVLMNPMLLNPGQPAFARVPAGFPPRPLHPFGIPVSSDGGMIDIHRFPPPRLAGGIPGQPQLVNGNFERLPGEAGPPLHLIHDPNHPGMTLEPIPGQHLGPPPPHQHPPPHMALHESHIPPLMGEMPPSSLPPPVSMTQVSMTQMSIPMETLPAGYDVHSMPPPVGMQGEKTLEQLEQISRLTKILNTQAHLSNISQSEAAENRSQDSPGAQFKVPLPPQVSSGKQVPLPPVLLGKIKQVTEEVIDMDMSSPQDDGNIEILDSDKSDVEKVFGRSSQSKSSKSPHKSPHKDKKSSRRERRRDKKSEDSGKVRFQDDNKTDFHKGSHKDSHKESHKDAHKDSHKSKETSNRQVLLEREREHEKNAMKNAPANIYNDSMGDMNSDEIPSSAVELTNKEKVSGTCSTKFNLGHATYADVYMTRYFEVENYFHVYTSRIFQFSIFNCKRFEAT